MCPTASGARATWGQHRGECCLLGPWGQALRGPLSQKGCGWGWDQGVLGPRVPLWGGHVGQCPWARPTDPTGGGFLGGPHAALLLWPQAKTKKVLSQCHVLCVLDLLTLCSPPPLPVGAGATRVAGRVEIAACLLLGVPARHASIF